MKPLLPPTPPNSPSTPPADGPVSLDPKIYLLPNLMTAGNLFCGFAATLKIITGTLQQGFHTQGAVDRFHEAIWFILAACVFDLLDGRLARLGGHESPFGREFDSLADIVSFGIAPALLVYKIVLDEFDRVGLIVAFIYLACGALRLARFNCISAAADANPTAASIDQGKNFKGFPIPAAAGVIASFTELMLWFDARNVKIGAWKFLLPPLMLFLSFMMFSQFRYPSFKAINWRTQRSLPTFLCIIVLIIITALNWQWMPAIIFLSYLMYGFLRPWLSRARRREIEQEIGEISAEPGAHDDEDDEEDGPPSTAPSSTPVPPAGGHSLAP
jgi:CDP-diacylglycerol--serine O-phosphatidyltransferase